MYQITYKNILKGNKKRSDFMRWLKVYWPVQQRWGAKSVKLWNSNEGDKRVVFCRYTVENIDKWNRSATGPNAETLVRALDEIVDINRMAMRITVHSTENQ